MEEKIKPVMTMILSLSLSEEWKLGLEKYLFFMKMHVEATMVNSTIFCLLLSSIWYLGCFINQTNLVKFEKEKQHKQLQTLISIRYNYKLINFYLVLYAQLTLYKNIIMVEP